MSESPFPPPRRVLWEITNRCDLQCDHCLVSANDHVEDELSTDEALALVDQMAALGVQAVSLTGGEPFLRKDWLKIAARVRDRGLKLRFSTNGHLIDDATMDRLVSLETESISVSIDGLKETHDRIRHPRSRSGSFSSFDRVVEVIAQLVSKPIIVSVRTTILHDNLHELEALHCLLKTLHVDRWVLQLGHPTGRLTGDEPAERCRVIQPSELPTLASFIVDKSDDPILQPRAFNSIGYFGKKEPLLRKSGHDKGYPLWNGCSCGKTVIGIEPAGGVKGCANQVGEPFVVGNIRKESLATIWNDRARWFWLTKDPARMSGYCKDCALSGICGGGCTTLAFRSTGEFFNNPYCLRRIERDIEGTKT